MSQDEGEVGEGYKKEYTFTPRNDDGCFTSSTFVLDVFSGTFFVIFGLFSFGTRLLFVLWRVSKTALLLVTELFGNCFGYEEKSFKNQ